MKYTLSFLMGIVTGAAIALLLAPSSGEELRSNIKTQADTQYAKLQDEYSKSMQELRTRLDKISSELQTLASRSE